MNATPQITTGLASQAGHWYQADGAPAYEIAGKNGTLRPVTLRDARKLNLYPSVTTVLGCAAKPGLEVWKVRQAILSALTLPRREDETEEAFAARALEDSKEHARNAALLGTMIHEQIERSFGGSTDPEWLPYVEPVQAWLREQFGAVRWSAEKSFAHATGFGGKVDLHSADERIVIDFKTKEFDDPADVRGWPEHAIQLAAYAHGLGLDAWEDKTPERWNLFVSTKVPGLVKAVRWDTEDYDRDLEMFSCLLRYWQLERDYRPRSP